MPSVLICGVNGFVGKHLARSFAKAGYEVDGLTLDEPRAPELEGVVKHILQCDLTSKAAVDTLDLSPYQAIVNLAGLANVGKSFGEPELYMRVNVDVLRFIGERVLAQKVPLRLIAISTGTVYDSNQPMPLAEGSRVAGDTSPYAKSKLAMEKAARQLQRAGLDCIVSRPFNHIGPGQGPGFILPDLYKGLQAALTTKKPLKVGNLKTRRDYTDVRDVVNAYVLLATASSKTSLHHTLYNVCSGAPRSGEEILGALQSNIPGSENVRIALDPSRIRPNDPMELKGSNERLHADTGWQPKIPFEQTVADFVASQKV
jgi:GDP-4-dehydro-6-deoxy-D-mannose reductase